MYSYIKGTLEEVEENHIVVENNGIGYRIFVTGSMMDRLPSNGSQIKIYTYLQVKEDDFSLYGFLTKDDRKIFRFLIGVNGIGPKGALAILSVMNTDDLRFAVLAGDSKAIAKAPGIGAKTAQRIILELKDKMSITEVLDEDESAPAVSARGEANAVKTDVLQALTALGYSSSEALSVLSKITITEDSDVEDILKEALKQMAFI